MRAQLFIESSPRTPSSAWAARPLASGALSSLIGRRGYSNVGVGCPSFGGQRTVRGDASRPLVELVTGPNHRLPAKRMEALSVAVTIQTARLTANANDGAPFSGPCHAAFAALSLRGNTRTPGLGLTGEYPMHEVFTHRRRTIWQPSCFPAASVALRSCRRLAQCHLPNPSVKGTSCAKAQAAPYLER
jgi:hypothetical protein